MTDYSRIATSSPVNAAAARVTGKGISWTPERDTNNWSYDKPEMVQIPFAAKKNPTFKDYTGMKLNRIKVLGLAKLNKRHKFQTARWVCRCDCGLYCSKTSKSLKKIVEGNGGAEDAMCGLCGYTKYIIRERVKEGM